MPIPPAQIQLDLIDDKVKYFRAVHFQDGAFYGKFFQ